ncbi:PDR/VanB family oxidoreductase [Acetobacter conturbans]|uniref:2Fe-2S iron-sulfur cluster binding domain-containing protein n=1 Tax=Acetobacter conturbans TaxID=1737472 RepID=A0ABX0JVC1_9PROT|nr:PDR/VanB family oxidoreductase [Acetobacter conturbans]NHN87224.1 2Fe-2S iron-sulfur cluster binding domain-containing protein [Acetobacter conturbans]
MNASTPSGQTLSVKVGTAEHLGDVLSFSLISEDGSPLPAWEAGAHVDLFLGDGLVRQYSLCGDPADRSCYRLAVLREAASRGGSQAVHDQVSPGQAMTIGLPRNLFPLAPEGEHTILVGGGIGVTPLIAMAYELYDRKRAFTLHYVARNPVFATLLAEMPFADSVIVHDRSSKDTARFDLEAALKPTAANAVAHVYTCGPIGLMDAVFEAGHKLGYPDSLLHREAFSAQPVTGGEGFTVLAAKSGVRVEVGADESIATALGKAGVKVTLSCEQGICGTCVVSVLEGEAEHRDEYLTEDERTDQIALCCSRSKTPLLVVDI